MQQADPNDNEIVTIDPSLGRPNSWMVAGAHATWVGKNDKQKIPVRIVGWRPNGRRVVIRILEGWREYNVPPDRLRKAPAPTPVAPGSSAGNSAIVTGKDPTQVKHEDVKRITVRVAGKQRYNGPVTPAAGELLTMLAVHGRKMVVTLHMNDGTKQRYRGNGSRTL